MNDEERRLLARTLARCERYGLHDLAKAYAQRLEHQDKETRRD